MLVYTVIIEYKRTLTCSSIIIHDSIFPGLNDLLNGFNEHKDDV